MNVKVSFYDNNGTLIADGSEEKSVIKGRTHLNLVFDNSKLNGKSINDIAKYYLLLNVQKEEVILNEDLYPSTNPKYSHYDYVIDSYKEEVSIGSNNVYNVSEIMVIHFNKDVASYVREYPLNGYKITDYKIDEAATTVEEGDNFKVKVESNGKAGEEYIYNISYKMVMDKDHQDVDFVVLPKWNTAIGSYNFILKLPKETSLDDFEILFEGKFHKSSNNKNEFYISVDEIIEDKTLEFKLDLPDDYFKGGTFGPSNITNSIWIPIVIVLLIVVPVIVVAIIKRKPKKKLETL